MRRLWGLALAFLVAAPFVPASAGELDGTFRGTALIRTDAGRRIVVVLDADGDGLADDAFLFDPLRALKQPIAPMTKEVTVYAEGSELEVRALDRSVVLRLSTQMPSQNEAATTVIGTTTIAYGAALVHYRLAAPGVDRHVALAEVDTDGLETMDFDSGPCGQKGTECTSGGTTAAACGGGCPTGGGSQAGVTLTIAGGVNGGSTKPTTPPCSTSCNASGWACCFCDRSVSLSEPTPKCQCRDNSELLPCTK